MWKRSVFESLKASIRQQLDQHCRNFSLQERQNYCLEQITRLANQNADPASMQRYIYIMHALNLQLQTRSLSESQQRDLFSLAEAILSVAGIKAKRSRLAFLFGELHLIQASLHQQAGQALHAAWEQQIAIILSGPEIAGGHRYQSLQSALQALRLGFANQSLRHLQVILNKPQSDTINAQAILIGLQLHRLRADWLGFDAWAHTYQSRLPQTEHYQREFSWESQLAANRRQESDLKAILRTIRPQASHDKPGYILEAFFWGHASHRDEHRSSLPKLKSLRQRKGLSFHGYPIYWRCANELEKLYDQDIPLQHRLASAKKLLEWRSQLPGIDKELLVLASLLRWLVRSQLKPLARLLLNEYRAKSRLLSDQNHEDALSIFSDLKQKSWLWLSSPLKEDL